MSITKILKSRKKCPTCGQSLNGPELGGGKGAIGGHGGMGGSGGAGGGK